LEEGKTMERCAIEHVSIVTKTNLKEYITTPLKEIVLINSFVATLKKNWIKLYMVWSYMRCHLSISKYPCAHNIHTLHEVWDAYIKDKINEKG
jgi:hypothetical protein